MWMMLVWVCTMQNCDVHEISGRFTTEELCQKSSDAITKENSEFVFGTATAACVPAPDKDPMMFE